MNGDRQECATRVIETIPLVMRNLNAELDRRGLRGMSIRRARTLRYLSIHRNASLTDLCRYLDATLSAGSKLVDGLVRDGLAAAETCHNDRRIKRISITDAGRKARGAIDRQLGEFLGERLASFSDSECAAIVNAMGLLRSVFEPPTPPACEQPRKGACPGKRPAGQ